MIEVIVLTCKNGSTYNKGCRCRVCGVKQYRRGKRYRTEKKQEQHAAYVKSIMKVALAIGNNFEDYCPQYRSELFSLARRYTGQEHTADDLVQETFLKAYRHWESFKQETTDIQRDVKVWLKKILTNTFFTEWQRDQRRSQSIEEYGTELDTSSDGEAESEETLRIRKVMDKLKPMYREVLDLHYLQDKSYQEIADLLDIKFVQVQKRLYRARQYIKTFYEQAGLNRSRRPLTKGALGVGVNPATLEATETEQSEADCVDAIVTGDDTKPLRRRKTRPDALASR